MLMSPGDNQPKRRTCWHGLSQKFFPRIDAELGSLGKELRTRERGAVIKNCDRKVKLLRQGRHRLGDMTRAGDPERARRRNGFLVKPSLLPGLLDQGNAKILLHSPGQRFLRCCQSAPDLSGLGRVGQDQAGDLPATNQSVVPTKIMV